MTRLGQWLNRVVFKQSLALEGKCGSILRGSINGLAGMSKMYIQLREREMNSFGRELIIYALVYLIK